MTLTHELKGCPEVWPDRETFLAWCETHGVKGMNPHSTTRTYVAPYDCLVAKAVQKLFEDPDASAGVFSASSGGTRFLMPSWMQSLFQEFDAGKLTKYQEAS